MQHVQLKDTPTECATELKTSQMQLRDKVLCDLFFSFCIFLLVFYVYFLFLSFLSNQNWKVRLFGEFVYAFIEVSFVL